MASSVSGASSGATSRFATSAYNGMAPKWSNCSGSVQSKAATGMDNAAARPWQRSGKAEKQQQRRGRKGKPQTRRPAAGQHQPTAEQYGEVQTRCRQGMGQAGHAERRSDVFRELHLGAAQHHAADSNCLGGLDALPIPATAGVPLAADASTPPWPGHASPAAGVQGTQATAARFARRPDEHRSGTAPTDRNTPRENGAHRQASAR